MISVLDLNMTVLLDVQTMWLLKENKLLLVVCQAVNIDYNVFDGRLIHFI